MHAEQLLPATGEPFGISYAFDQDPDGSYGWYNRLATEAVRASRPEEKSRLLRAYGARWALGGEEEAFPFFRPVIGVVVGGRRLVLHALDDPLPDLRWASRVHRRRSLSGALDLVRSAKFEPSTDVVLPGPGDLDAGSTRAGNPASLTTSALSPELAAGVVEAAEPGHLIFSRTYFGAWRGALDGAPARILVANARDLAIAVPGGRHRFEFSWDRRPFHRGVLWQAGALACAIAVAAATRARRPQDLRAL